MLGYDTFQNANNKGADQSDRMRRLVLQTPKDRFSHVEAHTMDMREVMVVDLQACLSIHCSLMQYVPTSQYLLAHFV